MRKYPFVKQAGLKDCGPACIQMILKYYKGYMSLDKLSILLCTSSKGTSAYHMVECLKYLGFYSCAYKYSDISSIKLPCIVHVNYGIYSHYIVIYEINYKKKHLIIGDPAKGIIKLDFNEFLSKWKGITIEMIPKQNIIKEKKPNAWKFIINIIKPNIIYFISIGILSFIISIMSIISSFFIQIVINDKLGNYNNIILAFGFVFFFRSLLNYIRNIFIIKMNNRIDTSLSLDTFKNIINLPYAFSKNKTAGEIISYFNDLFLIKKLISEASIIIFINFPLILIISLIILFMNYQLFILNIITLISYFLLYLIFHKRKYFLSDEVLRKKALTNSYITENINGFESINNLNIQNKAIDKFKDKYKEYININTKFERTKIKEFFIKDSFENISILFILIYGITNIKSSYFIGNFITLFFLFTLFNSSLRGAFEFDENFNDIASSINHINELSFNKEKNIVTPDGNIYIKNLNKSFNKIDYILKDINLYIKKGTKVIVTGSSGSGKSTLFKIIKGYYDYEGIVKIDDYDSNKYIFENVVYISSKEYLFTGTVKDNLSIRNNIQNREICELSDFIKDYNMLIFENGFNLSNGQRQRIILSRALSNFNIIIIDEGLDGIDVNMERRIFKKLFKIYQNKTIIYITHRIDNIDLFDRFIKIEKGQVVLDDSKRN